MNIKERIREQLNEEKEADAISMFKEYAIQYRANEKHSRTLTLLEVSALLSLVLKNAHSKVMTEKLTNIIQDLKEISKM